MPRRNYAVRKLHRFHRYFTTGVFYHCTVGIGIKRTRVTAAHRYHNEVAVAKHTFIRAFALAYCQCF